MEVCYFFFHCLWIVNCRKPSPIIKVKREFMFSFTICIVSSSSFFFTPTFISLIQLGFTLVYSVKYEYNFIDFIQMASSLFQYDLLKRPSFPSRFEMLPLSCTQCPYIFEPISELSSLFHWSTSLVIYQYHNFQLWKLYCMYLIIANSLGHFFSLFV